MRVGGRPSAISASHKDSQIAAPLRAALGCGACWTSASSARRWSRSSRCSRSWRSRFIPCPRRLRAGSRRSASAARVRSTCWSMLEARFPSRRAGSPADRALASLTHRGSRATATPCAAPAARCSQPNRGLVGARSVLLADRSGTGAAALSGTVALLELAHDLAARGPLRPLTLVSTDNTTVPSLPRRVAAAIVLGDLAGTHERRPFEIPFSNDGSVAPLDLQQTLAHWLPDNAGRPACARSACRVRAPVQRDRPGGAARCRDSCRPRPAVR